MSVVRAAFNFGGIPFNVLHQTLAKRCLPSTAPVVLSVITKLQRNHPVILPLAAQQRCQHTTTSTLAKDKMSTWEQMKWDMGFYGKLRVSKNRLHVAGFRLYVCCTDFIDFGEFVKELNIPDSFNSWFLVLQLHLWLVHVKLSQMDKEGLLLTQHLYKNMWVDVERRLNTFQELLGSEKAKAIRQFHSIMVSSIFHYDEGLIGSDCQLTNALWYQLFGMDESLDVRHLELMVEYVRKQVHHLDNQSHDLIMDPGYVSFLPLKGMRLDQEKRERDLTSLGNLTF